MSQIQKLHCPDFILGVCTGLLCIGICPSAKAQISTSTNDSNFIRQPIRSEAPSETRVETPLPETGQMERQSSQAPAEASLLVRSKQRTPPSSGSVLKWKPAGKKSVRQSSLTSKATAASINVTTQASLQRVAVQSRPIRQPTRKNTAPQPQPFAKVRFTPPRSFRSSEVPHSTPAVSIAPNTTSDSRRVVQQRGRRLVQYQSKPRVAEPQSESARETPKLNLVASQLRH